MKSYASEFGALDDVRPGSRAGAASKAPWGQAGTAQTQPWMLSDGCDSYPVMVAEFEGPGEKLRKRKAGSRDALGIAWRGRTTEGLFRGRR